VPVKHSTLNVGREEIGKRYCYEQQDDHHIGQPQLPIFHKHHGFGCKITKKNAQ
jgi:hypothetical protein